MIKCQACGKRYDYYEQGCCPECGAYNRPPRRNRVGVDGVVHHMSDAEFLGNSHKRRSSQSGKVCFERDVCFEDQARKVRGSAAKGGRKKSNPAKIITIVIIVIMVTNILPILLTMCSVGGMFEEIVDEVFGIEVGVEKVVPIAPAQPMSDLSGAEVIAFGQTFQWGDEMACVTEVTMSEFTDTTNVILTVQTDDPVAKPSVYYLLPDGVQAVADCQEGIRLDNGEYFYSFKLPDREPGSACYALFTGQTDGVWRMYEVPLN